MTEKISEGLKMQTSDFTQIPITERTLKKIKAYACFVDSSECYGFLLSSMNEGDCVVRNAILAPQQKTSGIHAEIDETAAANAKADIENMGYKAVGFWHSHGSMGAFHSGKDDGNLERLLLGFAGNTEEKEVLYEHQGLYRDGDYIVLRENGKEMRVGFEDADSPLRIVPAIGEKSKELLLWITPELKSFVRWGMNVLIGEKVKHIDINADCGRLLGTTGVAYSIVTNRYGDCYAELAKATWCDNCAAHKTSVKKGASLKIIQSVDDIVFDKSELLGEITEKISGFKAGKW